MLDRTKWSEQADFANLLARVRQCAPSSVSDPDKRLNAFLRFAKDGEFLRRHQWNLMRLGIEFALGNAAPTPAAKTSEQKEARSESSKASRLLRRKEEGEAERLGITREELSQRRIQECMAAVDGMIDAEAQHRASTILASWVCADGTNLADCDKSKLEQLALSEQENARLADRHSNFYTALANQLEGDSRVRSIAAHDFLSAFDGTIAATAPVGKFPARQKGERVS
jgi:hypothetical protein